MMNYHSKERVQALWRTLEQLLLSLIAPISVVCIVYWILLTTRGLLQKKVRENGSFVRPQLTA